MPEHDEALNAVSGRALWSGTVTFGLVSVPVNVLPANRADRVSLRMVSGEGVPLRRRYFAARDDAPLAAEELVRGYEVEKDRYVVVEDQELERLAPERTRDIDLKLFVQADEIDPMHFERGYYLTPAEGSNKAYRLLARAMEETGRAGIATFVMRAKEYLAAIFAENGILRLETLRFADELRKPEDISLEAPKRAKPADVTHIAEQIKKLEEPSLDRKEMVDRSEERLLKVVRKKLKKGEDVVELPEEEREGDSDEVIDLMTALQRSLRESTAGSGTRRSGARAQSRRKPPARSRRKKTRKSG